MKRQIYLKDYVLFLEAWCFLALARVIIFLLPFKIIIYILKSHSLINKSNCNVNLETLNVISLSINRARIRSFWRTKCFEQALAAKLMLNRRKLNSTIYFGVADNNTFLAHAWLECEGQTITGGKEKDKFTIINKF